MAFDLNDDFKGYKASVMSKTEKLIKEEFPKRVKMLNELLKSPIFKQNPTDPFIEYSHAYLHGQNEEQTRFSSSLEIRPQMEKLAENFESKMVFSSDANLKETMTTSTTCKPVETIGSQTTTPSISISTPGSSGLTPSKPAVTPCDSEEAPFRCITTDSPAVTPCNSVVMQIISLIKPKLVELSEAADDINIWFVLLTPKMEDGNNFGVEVQESVRDNIRHIFSNANTYITELTNYHLSRGNIMKKRAKYPGIADFAQSLKMADETMVHDAKCAIRYMIKSYTFMHETLRKNWDKIMKPRGETQNDLTDSSIHSMAYYG